MLICCCYIGWNFLPLIWKYFCLRHSSLFGKFIKNNSVSAEVSIKNRTHSGKFAGKIFLGFFFSRQANVLFLPLLKHNTYFHLLYRRQLYLYLILFSCCCCSSSGSSVTCFPGVQLHTAPANDRNIIDPLIRSFQRDYIIPELCRSNYWQGLQSLLILPSYLSEDKMRRWPDIKSVTRLQF